MANVDTSRPFLMTLSQVKPVDEDVVEKLYGWVDGIPLSRPKKNMARDFSDGVMVAELVHYFLPKYVQVHNYAPSNATKPKEANWFHLNKKVLCRLGLEVSPQMIRSLAQCQLWAAESFLLLLRDKLDIHLAEKHGQRFQKLQQFEAMNWDGQDDASEADLAHNYTGAGPGFVQREEYYPTGMKTLVPKYTGPGQVRLAGTMSDITPRPPQKPVDMVPRSLLQAKDEELVTKQQTIVMLNSKIQSLEHLLHLKDIRINDLAARMGTLESTFRSSPTSQQSDQPPVWLSGDGGQQSPTRLPAHRLRKARPSLGVQWQRQNVPQKARVRPPVAVGNSSSFQ